MNFTFKDISELKSFLEIRLEKIRSELWDKLKPIEHDREFDKALNARWVEYLNGIDCLLLDQDDIVEDFENLFNISAQLRICIPWTFRSPPSAKNYVDGDIYVLMSKELAEKALVLGWLPDNWFSETSER